MIIAQLSRYLVESEKLRKSPIMTCQTGLEKNLELESFLTTPNLNNFQPPESCKILGPDFENLCFDIISDVVEPKPAQDMRQHVKRQDLLGHTFPPHDAIGDNCPESTKLTKKPANVKFSIHEVAWGWKDDEKMWENLNFAAFNILSDPVLFNRFLKRRNINWPVIMFKIYIKNNSL